MPEPILGYATNCHAGESAAELIAAVKGEVAAVRRHLPSGEPLNLSLRISARAAHELNSDVELFAQLRDALENSGAHIVGANAFPISAPRGGVYKEKIYKPDWASRDRVEATTQIACVLIKLLAEGARGVLTTMTGLYRPSWEPAELDSMESSCARFLLLSAEELELVSKETGRDLVLALEPEPFTTAESLPETIRYFKERLFRGPQEKVARRRLAVNLDLCHAAVMFEDAAENLRAYAREGIPVAGLHVSAALRLENPAENAAGLAALSAFDEPVYLHQVSAVDRSGRMAFRSPDLGEFLALPRERLAEFAEARVHFHVPIFASKVGGLSTTADQIAPALREATGGNHTNLLIVETYTWKLLEGAEGAAGSTAEGIAKELDALKGYMR